MTAEKQLQEKASRYLAGHHLLTMATASLDGTPNATALEYASDGLDVYVLSMSSSWKINNIKENNKVFYEIHDVLPIEVDRLRDVIGIQVAATARLLDHGDPGFSKAFELLAAKFPPFKGMEHLETRTIIQLGPRKIWILDYSKKFFHRDFIDLGEW